MPGRSGPGARARRAAEVARLGLGVATGLAVLGLPAAALPRDDAVALARQGRCPAALPELRRALEAAPGDAELHLMMGSCHARLGAWPEAVESLEQARRLGPGLPGVALPLAVARYHLGDLEGASRELEAARASDPASEAELALYRGLVTLARADQAAHAAGLLEGARRRDPAGVEPVASYYAGLAWLEAGEAAAAREALGRVVSEWPGTPWASQAAAALARLTRERPAWLVLDAGLEWDDNAVLRGRGVELPQEIGRASDGRAVWTFEAGGVAHRSRRWSAGGRLRYAGSAYDDLDEFDAHAPSASAWLDRALAPDLTARLEAGAGYAWVDGAPFVSELRLGASLHRDAGRLGTTSLFVHGHRDEFFFDSDDVPDGSGRPGAPCPDPADLVCGPPGLDERRERDRDGEGLVAGLEQAGPLPFEEGAWLAGYRYHRFFAEGSEYDFQGHELRAALRAGLALGVVLDLRGGIAYLPHDRASTFPQTDDLVAGRQYPLRGGNRRDLALWSDVALERPFGRRLRIALRWSWLRNRSSADVFDYERHRVGLFVTVGVGRWEGWR